MKVNSISDSAFEVAKDSFGNNKMRNLWVLVVTTNTPNNIEISVRVIVA